MELTISVDPSLGNEWHARIERMVDLELSSISYRIRKVDVSLVTSLSLEGRLKCNVKLLYGENQSVSAVMISSAPRTCVLDALRRSKRELRRRLTLYRSSEKQAQSHSI